MPDFKIRRAAVLGAGVMGSRIAAHLANAGISCFLLDVVPGEPTEEEKRKALTLDSPAVRNRIVQQGWKAALDSRPPALFLPDLASSVTLGNFTDNLAWIAESDWVVEAVTEQLDIKRSLFQQVERHRKPGTIVSSNTSGIPIHRLAEGFSSDFKKHFLGTHFFNPPRYLKLVEVIPIAETDPSLIAFMTRFSEDALGKGVVRCKDTPNFIANRIGTYGALFVLRTMIEEGLTIEEVDLLTGPAVGRPKSATFRTFDVVGLDTMAHVAQNLYDNLPGDPERSVYQFPSFVHTMIANRWLGDKTGQGFYKKVKSKTGSEIHFLDPEAMEYRPLERPRFPSLDRSTKGGSLEKRLRTLAFGTDRVGNFLWKTLSATITYAAVCIPEISEDIVSVDRAMRWGFLHQLGPFETWDALGVPKIVERLQAENRPIPQVVDKLIASGNKTFYRTRSGKAFYFAPSTSAYIREEEAKEIISLRVLKDRRKVIRENAGATLLDLGDGVASLEFHTKMNVISADVLQMMHEAVDEVSRNFIGLVIANDAENFSAGANLYELLGAAKAGQWGAIEQAVRAFQTANLRLRYSEKPVVAAPHNLALGGGCEITIHCDQVHAAAELYIGFVEVGVGLIPGAGGCKEMALRAADEAGTDSDMDLFPRIRKMFEMIALAKVSSSALEAKRMGFLRESDHITMNRDKRIYLAKQDVLALVREGYRPPRPRMDIPVLGRPGLASLKLGIHMMERAGYITEHDKVVGTHLARVLTGGEFLGVRRVSEQHLLDLEREAFLSLCGEPKTQERMEYMLREGKPLRN